MTGQPTGSGGVDPTLVALAETFVRGDAVHRARLAADALAEVADPAQLAQLRLALRMLETPAANLAVARIPKRFTAMSPHERERVLLGWARSPVPTLRSGFQAYKKLLTFLAYADPGVTAPNPHWATIGYVRDDPPVTADRTPIVPFPIASPARGADGDAPVTLDADAVIVGSGSGGGVVAAALAEAGRSVVVLDAGPFVDEATMPTDELAAFDRLYLDHGLVTTWDGAITMLAGSAVGGGTLINWMTCLPAPADVRDEWAREHGVPGVDGAEWDADVAAIDAELDVHPASHIPPKDAAILRGAEALGWEAAPTRRDAVDCGDCGSCPFGCRRGTKRSGIRVHLARAAAAGARIVPDVRVERVLVEGGRATGVAGVSQAGRRVTVRARTVVVAAGALRSPAVLQRSGLEHPAIGRFLRLHPVPVLAGRFSESIAAWAGTMQGARSMAFASPEAGRNGYVIESAPAHPGLLALAMPWEGSEAHARLMGGSAHLSPLIAVTRDGGEGRARLTRAGRVRLDYRLDRAGIATMRHALVRMARLARAAGATEIVAVGTPATWFSPTANASNSAARFSVFESALASFDFSANRGAVFSAHQMGTARMGADPADHACDPWGRVRAGGGRRSGREAVVPGLYVADGSLFPTGIGANPMITVMALARRTARTILADG